MNYYSKLVGKVLMGILAQFSINIHDIFKFYSNLVENVFEGDMLA